ncbi:DNA gyrase subunit A [Provencibacterium massiliense]|uniref:DNA gyrase subunit A n=1 Tax=Provencibacterium massiliense TaxID=1841868 RepID=UPI0009A8A0A0|nr:DNA gyrase subunit A [Provencibacterium massiliense]RGB64682.1 topoisomerase IV [Harryflintia acetispora]
MAKSKKERPVKHAAANENAVIENAGVQIDQPITETLEKNYMPYAMSVIVSRAIPEIDGFKPSHRKLLYTMYKMGLLSGARTKSANVVGSTMKLNPHGDQAIYDTMVRLSRGYEALLHPYVDSKGNFGKAFSRDMVCAAPRYTEVKLAPIAAELFNEIDRDTVDMVDNYDGTLKEPVLLPVRFPTILVNSNIGIAVGMASSICPFNLQEVCNTTIELMKNPEHDISLTLNGPDFPGGGFILYDRETMQKIYATGRGGVRVRARYHYDKQNNCVEVTEIPPSTTVEAIMDKVVDLIKQGKIREISDMRDETDLKGLKLAIDLKRGVDPDKLMQKLFRFTPLEDSFSCNFNVLIAGAPRVMGVREILNEWIAFRLECLRRRVYFDLQKSKSKLHLLLGLRKILLDIDKAVRIVRETEIEKEVVPNLMIGFGIDEIQAEYVAEIKLRHLNREYILKRTEEVDALKAEIADMEETLASPKKIKALISDELREVSKKYGKPRRSLIIEPDENEEDPSIEEVPDYPVNLFFTAHGYFKKITPLSLRMSSEQMLKEGDSILQQCEARNGDELLFFTNKQQVYKSRACEFDDTKASVLGDYLPAKLGFDEGEVPLAMAVTRDYKGYMLFFFQNGKAAKVDLSAYQTKTRRKKLLSAFSDKSETAAIFQLGEEREFLMKASMGRMLIVDSGAISSKTTKNTQGVAVMTLRKNAFVERVVPFNPEMVANEHRFRTKNLPAAGALPRAEDVGEQLTL